MPGSPSVQRSHLVDRPISKDGLAVDVLLGDEPPHAAVVGLITVVAQHVKVAGLDVYRRIGSMVHELRQDVILIKRLVVDINNTTAHFNDVPGHPHDALDIGLCGIQRIPENDNIFTLNLFDPVNELVDENPFLVNDVPGHPHDALDIGLCGIQRIPENDNIFTLNLFDPVNELVDENPFLVNEFGQHTRPFNLDRLVKEDDDHYCGPDGEKYVPGP